LESAPQKYQMENKTDCMCTILNMVDRSR